MGRDKTWHRKLADGTLQNPYDIDMFCSICGKQIFPTPQWIYKVRVSNKAKGQYMAWQCSYTCHKKEQEKHMDTRACNRAPKRQGG